MCRTHPEISKYKGASSSQPLSDLILPSFIMNFFLHLALTFTILNLFALFPDFKELKRYDIFRTWKVIDRNSSGQLFWKVGTQDPRFLAWQPRPKADKITRPIFYYGTTTTPRTTTEVSTETSSQEEELRKITTPRESSTTKRSAPVQSAWERPRTVAKLTKETPDFRNQLFSHSTLVSHLVNVLNPRTSRPNLVAPHWKRKPFNEIGPSTEEIVNASDEISLLIVLGDSASAGTSCALDAKSPQT